MKTVLTEQERRFMKESVVLTLAAYKRTAEFYGKYSSSYSKNIVKSNKEMYEELLSTMPVRDKKGNIIKEAHSNSQNILIKHLKGRANTLAEFKSKDEGKAARCKVVSSKILELNKKLRRIRKETK